MKKFLKIRGCSAKSVLITSMVLATGSAMAAPISLINQGFETGDLSGWDTIGQVIATGPTTVVTNNGTNYLISPNESSMAFLDSFGASVSEIEGFFGIASGSLNATQTPFGNGSLTNGSAISQSFVASAGDTIDMSWNYAARDYIPYTDPSFAVLIAPDGTTQIETLASTTGPGLATGSDGISGVFSFAEELTQDGEYTIGFAVTNSSDTILNATLFLDDAAGECNPSCNELGSPENPLLPEEDDTPESFDFSFTVTEPSLPIFIDPIVAVGYNYIVNSGPNVASVILPEIGDGIFDVYGWDGSDYNLYLGEALSNIAFDFEADGVSQFQVKGIEVEEMLDPTDPAAFVTGLTFVDAGNVDISQIAITVDTDDLVDVPAPSSLGLLAISLLMMRRIYKKASTLFMDK